MKDDRVYLAHVRDAIDRILDYTSAGEKEFLQDAKTQDAVVRNLEVLGEAVKNVSAELRQSHESIPWRRLAGMRDKLIHEYFGVNLEIIWQVVARDLPELRSQIDHVLDQLKGEA